MMETDTNIMDFKEDSSSDSRGSGFIAIIGAPNVGKSTLVNRLVGRKVSIVSSKAQTTRSRICGIRIVNNDQLILVDTPGIFNGAGRRLERSMIHAAWKGEMDADASLIVIDARRGICRDTEVILRRMRENNKQPFIAINKIDKINPQTLLPLADKISNLVDSREIFMISALDGNGVQDLLNGLCSFLPRGPWLYPENQLTDISERILAAEITREKLFLGLHQELPYSLTVQTEEWQGLDDGSLLVRQIIFVERENHKQMILGNAGKKIRDISKSSREEIIKHLEKKVHLFIYVKVRPRWSEDPEHYRDLGLEFNI